VVVLLLLLVGGPNRVVRTGRSHLFADAHRASTWLNDATRTVHSRQLEHTSHRPCHAATCARCVCVHAHLKGAFVDAECNSSNFWRDPFESIGSAKQMVSRVHVRGDCVLIVFCVRAQTEFTVLNVESVGHAYGKVSARHVHVVSQCACSSSWPTSRCADRASWADRRRSSRDRISCVQRRVITSTAHTVRLRRVGCCSQAIRYWATTSRRSTSTRRASSRCAIDVYVS
jgi:hypothetical protein